MLNTKMMLTVLKNNFNMLVDKINRLQKDIPNVVYDVSPMGERITKLCTLPGIVYDYEKGMQEFPIIDGNIELIPTTVAKPKHAVKDEEEGYYDYDIAYEITSFGVSGKDLVYRELIAKFPTNKFYKCELNLLANGVIEMEIVRGSGYYNTLYLNARLNDRKIVYNSNTVLAYDIMEGIELYVVERKLLPKDFIPDTLTVNNLSIGDDTPLKNNYEDYPISSCVNIGHNNDFSLSEQYSIALGYGLKVNSEQFVMGHYNEVCGANYCQIVGYGNSDNERRNTYTLKEDGTGWFKQGIYVGGDNESEGERVATIKDIEHTNDPKDFVTLRDQTTGNIYTIQMRDGVFTIGQTPVALEIKSISKTQYFDGDGIDLSTLIVDGINPDGTRIEIDKNELKAEPDIVSMGTTEVTIVYSLYDQRITTTFNITVEPFDPEIALIDFEYIENNDGTFKLIEWKGTLNGKASEELNIPNNSKIII